MLTSRCCFWKVVESTMTSIKVMLGWLHRLATHDVRLGTTKVWLRCLSCWNYVSNALIRSSWKLGRYERHRILEDVGLTRVVVGGFVEAGPLRGCCFARLSLWQP